MKNRVELCCQQHVFYSCHLNCTFRKISEEFFKDLEVGGNTILKWILRTYCEKYGVM